MEHPYEHEENLDLAKYWRIVWRRKWIVLGVFIIVFVGVLLFSPKGHQTYVYKSTTTLQFSEENISNVRVLPFWESRGRSLYWGSPEGKIMAEITSYSVLQEVVKRLDLDKVVHGVSPELYFRISPIESNLEAPREVTFTIVLDGKDAGFRVLDPAQKVIGYGQPNQQFESDAISFTLMGVKVPQAGGEFRITIYPMRTSVSAVQGAINVGLITEEDISQSGGGYIPGAATAEKNGRRSEDYDPVSSAGILKIEAFWQDPNIAADISNTLAEVIVERNLDEKREKYTQTRNFIEQQLATFRQKLTESETLRQQYKKEEGIISLSLAEQDIVNTVADLEQRIADLKREKSKIQNYLEQIDQGLTSEDYLLISSEPLMNEDRYRYYDVIGQLSNRLVDLTIKKPTLLETLSKDHPEVIQLNKEIELTKDKLQKQIQARVNVIDSEDHSILEMLQPYKEQLANLPQKEVDLARLERNYNINEEVYTLLAKQYEETRLAEAGVVNDLKILDPATIPQYASVRGASGRNNILLGALIGLALGIGAAFALDYLDGSIKSIDEIEKELNLPVYGTIPAFKKFDTKTQIFSFFNKSRNSNGNGLEKILITNSEEASVPAEAYKTLRTNIRFFQSEKRPKSILVTSAAAKEGKSTTSSNLAVAMANANHKTVLVDCDLRNPNLHKFFKVDVGSGVSEIVTEIIDWQDSIKHTEVENLFLITAGSIAPNPAELVSSENLENLLATLKDYFDVVIIDSPPLIPVADSIAISSHVDGVLLVMESGRTDKKNVARAKSLLDKVNARTFGAVLNNVKEGDLYDYYGGKYKYHKYGYGTPN